MIQMYIKTVKLCFIDLKDKIEYFVHETFGEMRTMEMFDALNGLKDRLLYTEEGNTNVMPNISNCNTVNQYSHQ